MSRRCFIPTASSRAVWVRAPRHPGKLVLNAYSVLRGDREFGLVFERHLPEKVRLVGLPVTRGATVEMRADPEPPTWQVIKVQGRRRISRGERMTKRLSRAKFRLPTSSSFVRQDQSRRWQ